MTSIITNAEKLLPTSNAEKAKAFEALLIADGAEDFRCLEQKISLFCPFEAIGMVRQEILLASLRLNLKI